MLMLYLLRDRLAQFGCEEIPVFLSNHYPMYTAIGLNADPAVTAKNSATLRALVKQFEDNIEGSVDVSNSATFQIVSTTENADENVVKALVALVG